MSEQDTNEVTAEWLENKYFCYPIHCAECEEELAGAEENGALGTEDALAITAGGEPLCQDHPEKTAFVAAGVYAHGAVPCDTSRSFQIKDVIAVK